MNRKSLKELKGLIENDIECCKDFIEYAEGNQNPQVVEMYNKSVTRKETLETVLNYIQTGSKYQFDKKEGI